MDKRRKTATSKRPEYINKEADKINREPGGEGKRSNNH